MTDYQLIFFEPSFREHLLPLVFTKPVSELRTGILTIREKWEKTLNKIGLWVTEPYLSAKYKSGFLDTNLFVNGAIIPNKALLSELMSLKEGESLWDGEYLIGAIVEKSQAENFSTDRISGKYIRKETQSKPLIIDRPWKLFSLNAETITLDIELMDLKPNSELLGPSNTLLGDEVYVMPGATVEASVINSKNGPVYIGMNAEIMENSSIRGPFALGDHSTLKMSSKIYGPTTIGPHCKIGGEINNSVISGYSNKAHDGFLGNSVVGEWCNLGADTNNSNLKNNYTEVRLWDYVKEGFQPTGRQFCGMIMGDHSKCAINTMFNTGTVVGVFANIFGSGFPRNFVPSFSWGGAAKMIVYQLPKAMEVAEIVMERRNITLSPEDRGILEYVFELTGKYRNF